MILACYFCVFRLKAVAILACVREGVRKSENLSAGDQTRFYGAYTFAIPSISDRMDLPCEWHCDCDSASSYSGCWDAPSCASPRCAPSVASSSSGFAWWIPCLWGGDWAWILSGNLWMQFPTLETALWILRWSMCASLPISYEDLPWVWLRLLWSMLHLHCVDRWTLVRILPEGYLSQETYEQNGVRWHSNRWIQSHSWRTECRIRDGSNEKLRISLWVPR